MPKDAEFGISKGLTNYGDKGFSLFLRKAFIKGAGYTDSALERPVIGSANTGSAYNPCQGNAPQLIEAVKRGIMLVGLRKISPSEVVGKARGSAPAASTPRETASTSSGICLWQLLNSDGVMAMPTTGLFSISEESPIERANERRRKREKSRSP